MRSRSESQRSRRQEFATSPRFYPELLRIFRAVAPLVRFLNAPLLEGRRTLMQMLPAEDEGPLGEEALISMFKDTFDAQEVEDHR